MLGEVRGKRVLLLQGPMGPFFARLAVDLRDAGATSVQRIVLNAGDELFHRGDDVHRYLGDRPGWKSWLEAFVETHGVQVVALFGDMRPYHRDALEVADDRGLEVFVFEEGYLRPDHLTCERGGVNGNSSMPRDAQTYRDAGLMPFDDVLPVGKTFGLAAVYSALYALAVTLAFWRYPGYEHHRRINAWWHALVWARGGLRKVWFAYAERSALDPFTGPLSGRFFVVPLQVHVDAQLQHSDYDDVCDFMEEVADSFARCADGEQHLVFKHHPADRPFREYGDFVASLARRTGLQGRLHYVHDVHLPTLLRHAAGTVTINSTVGLSAIHHGAPTKVMGRAIYDIPGLTSQRTLDEFWQAPDEVDLELYVAFRGWMEHHNQANGSIWKRLPGRYRGTGVRWWDRTSSSNKSASNTSTPPVS